MRPEKRTRGRGGGGDYASLARTDTVRRERGARRPGARCRRTPVPTFVTLMVGAVCRIVSLLVVLVGAVACGKRLSSCAPAQLTCRNGGYVLEKDCHGRLPGKCKKEEFGIVTKCTCRPGYYGRDCSLHLEATRTCPRGTVYSNDGLSMQGMQRSICSVQYSQAFDNPLIKFRDHSIDVEVDPGHKRVKLSILTRSTSCTTMFNMFTCEVSWVAAPATGCPDAR